MCKFVRLFYLLWLFLFASATYAAQPVDSAYLDGGVNNTGLILCHGRGKHPTWKVVQPLRKGVHEQLGYHTLSIQLPNDDDRHWKEYARDFPEAYKNIDDAVRFLKQEKKVKKLYLMGHSMGSRMASAYMSVTNNPDITGLIIAGCRNNGGTPLDCEENLRGLTLPVLDIWGDGSHKDVTAAIERAAFKSATYTQHAVAGADHRFDGDETAFVTAVVNWFKKVNTK